MLTGENGILNKANNAKEETYISNEKEAIKLSIATLRMNNFEGLNFGKMLYDKTIENGSRWNIIILNDNQKSYGNDWIYVPKDTQLENYGDSKYNWVINYRTGEIVMLDKESYTYLSYNNSLAIENDLIFNLDSSIIENSNKEDIEKQLGENVELINIDWNDESGISKKSFNLDGIDDYIKIKYNKINEKKELEEKGFTFEFYGTVNGGTSYNELKEVIDYPYKGLFCYWSGQENQQANFRCGISENEFIWNSGYYKIKHDYSNTNTSPWNIRYPYSIPNNEDIYISLTFDKSKTYSENEEEYYMHSLYINGKKMFLGKYNKKGWDEFINKYLNDLNYFCVGRSSYKSAGYWHYSRTNAYAIRLYNKGLTENEVIENYNKTVGYHNLIQE